MATVLQLRLLVNACAFRRDCVSVCPRQQAWREAYRSTQHLHQKAGQKVRLFPHPALHGKRPAEVGEVAHHFCPTFLHIKSIPCSRSDVIHSWHTCSSDLRKDQNACRLQWNLGYCQQCQLWRLHGSTWWAWIVFLTKTLNIFYN